ncbi:MAG TPA: hypothetical protein VIW02_02765 [Gammaproteobacteria bacterium]
MRVLLLVFIAAAVLAALGLLVQPRDPRLGRVLLAVAGFLALLLVGGFFGLFGGG